MKQIYLFCINLLSFLLFIALDNGYAQTIHRITTGMNLQTEIDNAPSGDIYLVEGGVQNTNLDIDKKVTIFGTGYFLNTTQASPGVATVSHIRLKPGSDGSYISGLQTLSINISANNVVIKNCYVSADKPIRLGYTGLGDDGGEWNGTANNCMILQNYAGRLEIINQNAPTAKAYNFQVKGNIFYRYGFHLEGDISGEISNNTFNLNAQPEDYISALNTTSGCAGTYQCNVLPVAFRNNIMVNVRGEFWGCARPGWGGNVTSCPINSYTTTDFNGNVFTQDFTNLPSSNTINADPDALFLGYPTNQNGFAPDARAQLAASSPAKGAGVGGVDAGAFGGDTPYVLNGIPTIPTIYQLTVPTQVSQGGTLNVQIKAKTNN